MNTVTTYHVFADNIDEWFSTLPEAELAYEELCRDMPNVRLYEDVSEIDGDIVDENYLKGQGEYPY